MEEYRTVEFALTVNADVKEVFVVVFKLNPASAVRDDLAEEIALGGNTFEEHAGRTVQLADDDAFGAVHDKRPVVCHQRDFAEEDFLFLDVANALGAGFRVLGVDGKTNRDLEWRGISHATLLALGLIVLQLQAYGIAALVAEGNNVLVKSAAMVAEDVARMEGVCLNRRAAGRVAASGAKVVQSLEVAALAFPVTDRIIDKFQLAHAAEIGNREYRRKHRLQTYVVALIRQQVHLQKLLVGIALDFDQIRDRYRSFNLGKINSIGGQTVLRRHKDSGAPFSRRDFS